MKSKYTFEKLELDGQIVAVPVGDNASDLHAVLNLNEEAMRILELLKEETTILFRYKEKKVLTMSRTID